MSTLTSTWLECTPRLVIRYVPNAVSTAPAVTTTRNPSRSTNRAPIADVDHHREHHRGEDAPSRRRGRPEHDLHEQRQERQHAEHRHAEEDHDDRRRPQCRDLEQVEREQRLRGAGLDEQERAEQHRADPEAADDGRRAPCVVAPGRFEREEERPGPAEQREDTEPVELVLVAMLERLDHEDLDEDGRDDPDGDVDVEDPAPRQVVGEEPAKERSDDRREREHRRIERRDLGPLLHREEVGGDRLRHRDQAAGTEALQAPERDELRHRLRVAGEHRADEEDEHPGEEDALAPEHVGEASPQRDRRDLEEQVGRRTPTRTGRCRAGP